MDISNTNSGDWSKVLVTCSLRDRGLLDAWVLAWKRLKLDIPTEMSIVERRPEWVEFQVLKGQFCAVQSCSRLQIESMKCLGHFLEDISARTDSILFIKERTIHA